MYDFILTTFEIEGYLFQLVGYVTMTMSQWLSFINALVADFEEVLPQVEAAIESAEFLAFDTEFTGCFLIKKIVYNFV